MGFNLDREGIRIKIVDETTRPAVEVVHILREPDAKEWAKFHRENARFRTVQGEDGKVSFEKAGDDQAYISLWEAVVLEVEGYDSGGTTVADLTPELKGKIPSRHKLEAARALDQLTAAVLEEDRKNSFPPSGSSEG